MANRQTGNKSRARKTDQPLQQNVEQNQLGLKEAYAILQQDYLGLKKAYLSNEQQLLEMQEQYFILQQSYQKVQQDSQHQQAQLLEKLAKSYDAYNEKFTEVEELEEKYNKCNKNLEEMNKHNENQVNAASLQDQLKEVNYKRQILEEGVMNSLANVGLSLIAVNGQFEINILDYKRLRQFVGYNDDHTTNATGTGSKKVAELKYEKDFLQQTLLSLREYSEKQQEELKRTTDMLQKKTEAFLNFQQGIEKQEFPGSILVEAKDLQKVVTGLTEMHDFVVELKRTIYDQNMWIDMLVEALHGYGKPRLSEDDKNEVAGAVSNTATHSASSGGKPNSAGGRKKKKKTKNKPSNICSDTASDTAGSFPESSGVVKTSGGTEDESLKEFEDYIVVPSGGCSSTERTVITNSTAHHLPSSFSSLQTNTRVPMNRESQSLRNDLSQMSDLAISDREKTREQFEMGSQNQFRQDAVNVTSNEKGIVASDDDKCPMCGKIFERNCGLDKRRSHINSHFED